MSLALGDLIRGLVLQRRRFAAQIEAADGRERRPRLALPAPPRYRRYIDSTFADMKNALRAARGQPGARGEFLHEFAGDGPWAHVDMAGPGYLQRKRPDYMLDEGGTGYGVRLIVELAQALASP